jgi:hypothetical protein
MRYIIGDMIEGLALIIGTIAWALLLVAVLP